MSEPVSNDEVEDVLSSIRRLVSEEKRPLQNTSAKPASSRLVLTPALRVAEMERPSQDPVFRHGGSAEDKASEEPDSADADEQETAESRFDDDLALYDSYQETPEEDELRELISEHSDDMPPTETPAVAEQIPETWEEEEDYADEAFWEEDEAEADAEEAEVLTLHNHVAEEEAEAEAETISDAEEVDAGDKRDWDRGDEIEDRHEPDALHEDDLSYSDVSAQEDADDASDDGLYERLSEEAEHDKASELTAKITALETAIGSIRQEWEPDDPNEDAFAGTKGETLQWEDNVELDAHGKPVPAESPFEEDAAPDEIEEVAFEGAEVDAEPVEDPEDDASEPEPETLNVAPEPEVERPAPSLREVFSAPEPDDEEEAPEAATDEPEIPAGAAAAMGVAAGLSAEEILDEEALRDLVSEIVRSELQGALGERITRNVRKLVRREIHRALTAQELD